LKDNNAAQIEMVLKELVEQQQQRNQWLMLIAVALWLALGALMLPLLRYL
jgi:hypothetical protein